MIRRVRAWSPTFDQNEMFRSDINFIQEEE